MSTKDPAGEMLIDSIRKTRKRAADGPAVSANSESASAAKKKAGKKAGAKASSSKKSAAKNTGPAHRAGVNPRAGGRAIRSFRRGENSRPDPFQRGRRVWPD